MGQSYKRECGTSNGICFVLKAKILPILQAASSQQPVGLHRLIFHSFRWSPSRDTFHMHSVSDIIYKALRREHAQMQIKDLHRHNFNSSNRFLSDIYINRAGSSELVGFLSRVWAADMWTRTVHCHPDSDSSSMCKKQSVMLSVSSVEKRQHQNGSHVCIHRSKPPPSCTTCPLFLQSLPFSVQVKFIS